MARNIVEYTKGQTSQEYSKLTSLLHYKPETDSITLNDLASVFSGIFTPPPTFPADDTAEAAAITNALGPGAEKIATWPTKSMISNTGAASGALDVVTAARAIAEGKIGAAKNCEKKAKSCELNITSQTLEKNIRYALCCSYTFGGQTAAVVLKNINGEL